MPFAGFIVALTVALVFTAPRGAASERPNVVIVMTDDQGYGDLSLHGNPILRTPHIDALAARSAQLANFYVSPVCTPTRAALMTGRYCQRTTAVDTWIGRAMLAPGETTIAELLGEAGWATGMFGKWHLGDCYPMRAIDQGFETALVHRGGGIGQPADPEGGEGNYTDAILFRDGSRTETTGYCTDVYFEAALDWMREQHDAERPFFAYIATNAPHGPYHDVPPDKLARYLGQTATHAQFPSGGYPLEGTLDADVTARIFAMIENIDDNVGRLVDGLSAMGAARETLVIYLQDNGPQQRRYNCGLRGWKGSVYEGGIRSPLLACWPGRLDASTVSDRIAAHVDLLPTVLDACSVSPPDDLVLDGRSVLPLLEGEEEGWPDRGLFIQAHRGDTPVRWANAMVRTQDWKLVSSTGFGREMSPDRPVVPDFELYDMRSDSFELHDVAEEHGDVATRLAALYDEWFDDVERHAPDRTAPPPITIGGPHASDVHLTRQDWRRTEGGGWGPRGRWRVHVADAGPFRVRVRVGDHSGTESRRVALIQGGPRVSGWLEPGERSLVFDGVTLVPGTHWIEVTVSNEVGSVRGPHQVVVEQITAPPATLVPVSSDETRGRAAGWGADRTWMDQHHDINEHAGRPDTIELVLLGDSITQSWGGQGRTVGGPGIAALRKHLGTEGIANMGISGDGTAEVLWRLNHGNLDGLTPEAVVLLIGTNDISAGSMPEAVARGIGAIVDRIAALAPHAHVVVMSVLPRGAPHDENRLRVDRVNDLLAPLALRPDVTVLDLASSFLEPNGMLRRDLYSRDGLHLAPAGYEVWGTALARLLGR